MQGREAGAKGPATDRLICGDPLRTFAALAVVLYHVTVTVANNNDGTPMPEWLSRAIGALDGFIFLFFAMSAFVITAPFMASLVLGERRPRIGRFVLRRAVRIFPALWLWCALTLVFHGRQGASAVEVAAVFGAAQVYFPSAFADAITQAWTVGIEVAFYILVLVSFLALSPPLARLRTPERRAGALVALIAVAFVASGALRLWAYDHGNRVLFESAPAVFYAFCPGLVLAALAPVLRARVAGSVRVRRLAIALALAVLAAYVYEATTDEWRPRVFLWVATGCGALSAAILYEWSNGAPPRLLASRVLAWVGERTYTLYLSHLLIISGLIWLVELMPNATVGVAVVLVVVMAASIAAAALSWRFFEFPLNERVRRMGVPRGAPEVRPTAMVLGVRAPAASHTPGAADPDGVPAR